MTDVWNSEVEKCVDPLVANGELNKMDLVRHLFVAQVVDRKPKRTKPSRAQAVPMEIWNTK